MSTRSARYGTLGLQTPKGRMVSGADRDAAAFLEAAQIFNTRQQQAIFELTRLLKQYGLWSSMKAIYPFVGGTATTHKWNLKDARDVDAAYRLTFAGGWTHSGTGILPNGTTAYADTFFSTDDNPNFNGHMSLYSRTNFATTARIVSDIGHHNSALSNYTDILVKAWLGSYIMAARWSDQGDFRSTTAIDDTRGFYSMSRQNSANAYLYKNGEQVFHNQTSFTAIGSTRNIYIGATNGDSGAQWFSERELAFVSIGLSLTATQHAALNQAVVRYQRLLGRAI